MLQAIMSSLMLGGHFQPPKTGLPHQWTSHRSTEINEFKYTLTAFPKVILNFILIKATRFWWQSFWYAHDIVENARYIVIISSYVCIDCGIDVNNSPAVCAADTHRLDSIQDKHLITHNPYWKVITWRVSTTNCDKSTQTNTQCGA